MPETHTVRDCTLYTLTTYAKSVEPLEAHIKKLHQMQSNNSHTYLNKSVRANRRVNI